MNKAQLRKEYIQKRKNLESLESERLSSEIVKQFENIGFHNLSYVHIFYPIIGRHEFDSLLLKEYLSLKYPTLKFVLPKSNIADNTLTNILWEVNTPLSMSAWGITEPERGEEVSPNVIDAVIVPLLAFDKSGHRLGYGKGFYDRFLAECREDVLKIGVCYFEPEERFTEVDPYDVPLDFCVTPKKIWEFK
jgi:5-formyltetrahydrofolate cyclo-ligase